MRVEPLGPHRFAASDDAPALLLGYAALSEQAIRRGVAELAAAVDGTAAR